MARKTDTSKCPLLPPDRQWLTLPQAADLLEVQRYAVSYHLRRGGLAAYHLPCGAIVVAYDSVTQHASQRGKGKAH